MAVHTEDDTLLIKESQIREKTLFHLLQKFIRHKVKSIYVCYIEYNLGKKYFSFISHRKRSIHKHRVNFFTRKLPFFKLPFPTEGSRRIPTANA